MLQIGWTDEYEIDRGVIDNEHRTLFDLANRVFGMATPEIGKGEIVEVVKALFHYMEYHFRHEEELMVQCDYPDLLEHTQCHRRIAKEMANSLRATKDIRLYAVELRHTMVDWVLTHMINEDKKIGAYLKKCEASATSLTAVASEPIEG